MSLSFRDGFSFFFFLFSFWLRGFWFGFWLGGWLEQAVCRGFDFLGFCLWRILVLGILFFFFLLVFLVGVAVGLLWSLVWVDGWLPFDLRAEATWDLRVVVACQTVTRRGSWGKGVSRSFGLMMLRVHRQVG